MLRAFDIKYFSVQPILANQVAEFTEGVGKYETEVERTPDKEMSLISTSHPPL